VKFLLLLALIPVSIYAQLPKPGGGGGGGGSVSAATTTVLGTVTTTTSNTQVVSTNDARLTGAWNQIISCSFQSPATGCGGDFPGLPSTQNPILAASTSTTNLLYGGASVYASLPAASTKLGFTYKVTDGATSACAAGSGTTTCYVQSNGTSWVLITAPIGYWQMPGGVTGTCPACPLLFQKSITLPSNYNAANPINIAFEYQGSDSTHAVVVTPSYGCSSTGSPDTVTLTAGTPFNLTSAAAFGRSLTTITVSPTCAAGNRFTFQGSITTANLATTAVQNWPSVTFYQ